jgi:hypothetical protein
LTSRGACRAMGARPCVCGEILLPSGALGLHIPMIHSPATTVWHLRAPAPLWSAVKSRRPRVSCGCCLPKSGHRWSSICSLVSTVDIQIV